MTRAQVVRSLGLFEGRKTPKVTEIGDTGSITVKHEVPRPMQGNNRLSRRQVTTTIGVGAAAALAGCSANFVGQTSETEVPTIKVAGWGQGVEREIIQEILRNYDSSNESVNVSYQAIPGGQYTSKLKTQFAGGTEPDVFYLSGERCLQYIENGAILDLSPHLGNDPEYEFDDLLDNLLEPFRYQGGIYGIPKDFTPVGLYYNASHLEEAGVGEVPETWDGLRSAFEAVKQNTDIEYPMGFAGQPRQTFFTFLFQNGGEVLNDGGTECLIGSNEAIEALQFLVDLHDDGLAGIYSDEISVSWSGPALGEEHTTTAMAGAWVFPTLQDQYSDVFESIEMVEEMPIPSGGQQTTMLLTVAWAASGTPADEQAAAELVKALTGTEGMWEWAKTGIALPSRQSLLDRPYYDERPMLDNLAQFTDGGKPFNFGIHHERIVSTILSEVEGALTGVKSADNAMKSAQRLINNNIL